jgi:hypothetical protein
MPSSMIVVLRLVRRSSQIAATSTIAAMMMTGSRAENSVVMTGTVSSAESGWGRL